MTFKLGDRDYEVVGYIVREVPTPSPFDALGKFGSGPIKQKDFRTLVPMVLAEVGGKATKDEMVAYVRPMIEHRLTEADLRPYKTYKAKGGKKAPTEPRWVTLMCWAVADLRANGDLLPAVGRDGIWELPHA